MKNIVMLAALAGTASVSMADVLLTVDLSVVNQVTITSTTGLSAATVTGSTSTGVYLQNFFNGAGVGAYGAGTGAFRSVNGSAGDNTPSLFRSTTAGGDPGLNIWSFATTATFTTGQQAFSGSGTWTVTAAQYANLIAGNTSGNLYFPADTFDDVAAAQLLGTWAVVPTPGAAAVLGLGGLAGLRRRRA